MSPRTRILLFDWLSGGHHSVYLRRFSETLSAHFDVAVAAPDTTVEELADLGLECFALGERRPTAVNAQSGTWALRSATAKEVELLTHAAERLHADHVVHMYADAALPRLATRRRLPTPVTIVLFYPRAHYPAVYQTHLPPAERIRAWGKEGLLRAWRRRSDANAVLTLDEEAVRRWIRTRGAPAFWLPEPPLGVLPELDQGRLLRRSGCILYGALAERKGIDLLSRAVSLGPTSLRVTLAGPAGPEFLPRVEGYVSEMRRSGATVDLRARRHSELDGLRALAGSRCAVLPYPRHDGMSRVLLEAASVGTPVVVHDRGLLGHLVLRYRLGLAVDCRNPRALRRAIFNLTEATRAEEYADSLARFSALFSPDCFERALLAPFQRALSSTPGAPRRFGRPGLRRPRSASMTSDSRSRNEVTLRVSETDADG
jgi:glycosyltransferase involved in cell wall biosynthesis